MHPQGNAPAGAGAYPMHRNEMGADCYHALFFRALARAGV